MKYIWGSWLFDSIEGAFFENPCIVVDGELIADVLVGCDFASDPFCDGEIFDLRGYTILPGLVDAHDHLSLSPHKKNHPQLMMKSDADLTVQGILNMRTDLLSGVTTARCCGDKNFVDLTIREGIECGELIGPRIYTSTRGIKTSFSHGFVGTARNGCLEMVATIRENYSQGADFTKLFVTGTNPLADGSLPYFMSPEEIEAVIAETHRRGKMSAAHCVGGKGLDVCLEKGLDVFEHAYWATDAQLEALEKGDRWVVLTPCIYFNDRRWATVGQEAVEEFAAQREALTERYRVIAASAIRTAIGTDASHGELVDCALLMHEHMNVSIVRALQGITMDGAKLCGMDNRVGALKKGYCADIVACSGNAAEDLNQLRAIRFVMKGGTTYRNEVTE